MSHLSNSVRFSKPDRTVRIQHVVDDCLLAQD